jgi:hypothetical protein
VISDFPLARLVQAEQHSGGQIQSQRQETDRQTIASCGHQIIHDKWVVNKADEKRPCQDQVPAEERAEMVHGKYVERAAKEGRGPHGQMAKAEQRYKQANQDGIENVIVAGWFPNRRPARSDEPEVRVSFVESD